MNHELLKITAYFYVILFEGSVQFLTTIQAVALSFAPLITKFKSLVGKNNFVCIFKIT
jgi:hypothetical protein